MPIYDAQHEESVSASTSGAQTTELYRYTIPADKAAYLDIKGAASGGAKGQFHITARAENVGGTSSVEMAQQRKSFSVDGTDVTLAVDGADLLVSVTGTAGDITFVARPEIYVA